MEILSGMVEQVWLEARKVEEYDENWRVDRFGSPMHRREYKNRESPYGWVIQRVRKMDGEFDVPQNFQAVQIKNLKI